MNLSVCNNITVEYNIPVEIEEKDIDKYDPSSDYYNNECNMDDSSEENIPQPEIPFLKAKDKKDKREYTLVLDLDETLVHYMEDEEEYNAYVKVRLGAENFINELSKFCEIVIFTASTEDYANTVINGLDCKNNISYKLYRQHTNFVNGFNIKDLLVKLLLLIIFKKIFHFNLIMDYIFVILKEMKMIMS